MTEALVLVAMGIDGAARAGELLDLAVAVDASLAFLQGAEPSLTDELDRLHAAGARSIVVASVPVDVTGPARSWLTRVVATWRTRHPDTTVTVRGREVMARDTLTSPAWEHVPGHRTHVLLCRGPRCAAKGAADTAVALGQALSARGLGDDDILVTQTGCLFPCNHAPLVVVHPDDRWFGPVPAEHAEPLVEHLVSGREFGPLLDRRRRGPLLNEQRPRPDA